MQILNTEKAEEMVKMKESKLKKAATEIRAVLESNHLNYYEGAGVLEAVKGSLFYDCHRRTEGKAK